MAALEEHLPADVKAYIANNDVKFYTIDATTIAREQVGFAKAKNMVLQSAFFALANIIGKDEADGGSPMGTLLSSLFAALSGFFDNLGG